MRKSFAMLCLLALQPSAQASAGVDLQVGRFWFGPMIGALSAGAMALAAEDATRPAADTKGPAGTPSKKAAPSAGGSNDEESEEDEDDNESVADALIDDLTDDFDYADYSEFEDSSVDDAGEDADDADADDADADDGDDGDGVD